MALCFGLLLGFDLFGRGPCEPALFIPDTLLGFGRVGTEILESIGGVGEWIIAVRDLCFSCLGRLGSVGHCSPLDKAPVGRNYLPSRFSSCSWCVASVPPLTSAPKCSFIFRHTWTPRHRFSRSCASNVVAHASAYCAATASIAAWKSSKCSLYFEPVAAASRSACSFIC